MAVFVAQTVSIKRRLGKPSKQHRELKKLLRNMKRNTRTHRVLLVFV